MTTRHDPIGAVFEDLTLLGSALRTARARAVYGTPWRTDLVLALRAGERAQLGLLNLLVASRVPVSVVRVSRLRASRGLAGLRAGRGRLASCRRPGRAPGS